MLKIIDVALLTAGVTFGQLAHGPNKVCHLVEIATVTWHCALEQAVHKTTIRPTIGTVEFSIEEDT